ncbi:MAG: DegV family protein [Anaeroplasma sp.]
MKKTKVIVCSNSGIDYVNHPYDIDVFRSIVQYSEEEKYDDYTEISAETFYTRLVEDKESFPHTAYVSVGHMIETFENAKKEGYDSALVITISKCLSGLNAAISIASENVSDFEVVVYDSHCLAYPEALMAIDAARMLEEGKSINDVLKRLDYIRDNNHMIFAVDTLEYLIKNGRLSKVAGAFANMLAIRPILDLDPEGKVRTLVKGRTSIGARKKLTEMYLEEIKDKIVIPFILHANAEQAVIDELRNAVKAAYPQYTDIPAYLLTPVVGAHTGPKTICLGYIIKDN